MRYRHWAAFLLLGLIWGSSFLWIKIAVGDISALMLVALRFTSGLLGLWAYAVWRRVHVPWPRDRATWAKYGFMGIINTALPIALVSWGEKFISSGLAAILTATVPLFAIVVAHLWLHDERVTARRLGGLIVGFAGVVVVMLPGLVVVDLRSDIVGQAAVLLAALCYALGGTYSRRHLRGESPLTQSTMTLLVASAVSWASLLLLERPLQWPTAGLTWFAAAWLGLLASGLAYVIFFGLIQAWGVTRTSLVTYLMPVIGLALGALFLSESVGWNLVAGLFVILAGIAVVNRPSRRSIGS